MFHCTGSIWNNLCLYFNFRTEKEGTRQGIGDTPMPGIGYYAVSEYGGVAAT